jgi:Ca-activated chloride channel family protein
MRFGRISFWLPVLLFVAGAASSAFAQNPRQTPTPAPTPEDEQTVRVRSRLVNLPVTVMDKKGQRIIDGLTRSDFLVYEDKQPQTIQDFITERGARPVYVAVLMDTSGSTAAKLQFEREAAKDFIYTVLSSRKDRAAFATFDDDVNLLQDFTDRLDLLEHAIDSVKKPGRKTVLYDAIYRFCNEKMRGLNGRRVIVVITDGVDTYSHADIADAIDIAQRTETILFAISTKAGFSGSVPGVEAGQVLNKDDRELVRLCEETGGRAFFTGDRLALERSFKAVSDELRAQYIITYIPTNTEYDGRERKIEVKLVNNPNKYKVRAKTGYRAVNDTIK